REAHASAEAASRASSGLGSSALGIPTYWPPIFYQEVPHRSPMQLLQSRQRWVLSLHARSAKLGWKAGAGGYQCRLGGKHVPRANPSPGRSSPGSREGDLQKSRQRRLEPWLATTPRFPTRAVLADSLCRVLPLHLRSERARARPC